jgi:phosphoribosylanthranilate isomerase
MTQIKICGITNEEDALYAAGCGAAALGFIFYAASPRYVAPEEVRRVVKGLPEKIVRVGVFVNESVREVKRIVQYCGLDFVQLHGDESVEYCHNFPPAMIIKAFDLRSEIDLTRALSYNVAAILVDSGETGIYGGTGKKSNWDLALRVKSKKPLILSGGLNETNIKEALKKVAPHALDINSGVEMNPGKKDHKKITRIFDIVRSLNLQAGKEKPIFMKREIK